MTATGSTRSSVQRHPSRVARLVLGSVFVALLLVGAVGLAGYVWPAGVTDAGAPVVVGVVDDYEIGSVTGLHSFSIRGYLVRLPNGSIRVYDQREPVNGCSAPWHPKERVFRDPCYGFEYDIFGQSLRGSGVQAVMGQYDIDVSSDGEIRIDLGSLTLGRVVRP